MTSEIFIKARTLILLGILILFYPFIIVCAIVWKILEILYSFIKKKKSISGEVAVITGSGHGLGKAIAIELAKLGCHIAIVDINLQHANDAAKEIREKFKVNAKAYKVDVSNYEEVAELNRSVTKDLGTTTIVINNAGILLHSNMLNPECHDMERMIRVNYLAHIWANRIFLPKMKHIGKGHIVAISSIAGLLAIPYNGVYSSTKFAVRGLMQSLRQELEFENYHNLHVTTVCPSFLQTNDHVKEMSVKTNTHKIYPLIPGETAAQRIVNGMLHNEEEIVIPEAYQLLYRLLQFLPLTWIYWIAKKMTVEQVTLYQQHRKEFSKDAK